MPCKIDWTAICNSDNDSCAQSDLTKPHFTFLFSQIFYFGGLKISADNRSAYNRTYSVVRESPLKVVIRLLKVDQETFLGLIWV